MEADSVEGIRVMRVELPFQHEEKVSAMSTRLPDEAVILLATLPFSLA
jgi:hypothetical protein